MHKDSFYVYTKRMKVRNNRNASVRHSRKSIRIIRMVGFWDSKLLIFLILEVKVISFSKNVSIAYLSNVKETSSGSHYTGRIT